VPTSVYVAFGGVALLGLIGFLYAWFAPPDKGRKPPPKST
jgi:hypothetical protein